MTVQIKSRIPSPYNLPDEYGAKVISEGQSVYINDTLVNVNALLGQLHPSLIELRLVPNGQPNEITPAPSPAHRAASYVVGDAAKWANPVPTTVGAALDRLAARLFTVGTNTPIP